jgi:hypothetical protein
MIVPISRKIMMSLEFSMMKAVMEHSYCNAEAPSHILRSAGKYQPACGTNVSSVTEDSVVFIQAGRVKAFSSPLHPCRIFGGVFLFRMQSYVPVPGRFGVR